MSDCGYLGHVGDSFRVSSVCVIICSFHRLLASELQSPFSEHPAPSAVAVGSTAAVPEAESVQVPCPSLETRKVLLWLDVNGQPAPAAFCFVMKLSSEFSIHMGTLPQS